MSEPMIHTPTDPTGCADAESAHESDGEFCIEVTVDDRTSQAGDGPDVAVLIDRLSRVAERLGISRGRLSLAIVSDAVMADLHQRFSGVPGTTDVLTFDYRDDADNHNDSDASAELDGEIVMCLDEASRRANELRHALADELLLYAVHGLLHLLGYDDRDPPSRRRMHAKEDELLTAIGVGAVYDPRRDSSSRGTSASTTPLEI